MTIERFLKLVPHLPPAHPRAKVHISLHLGGLRDLIFFRRALIRRIPRVPMQRGAEQEDDEDRVGRRSLSKSLPEGV